MKFVARIGVHTSSGSWQSAMIPINLNGEVNKNQLHNFGLRIDETRRKWIYESERNMPTYEKTLLPTKPEQFVIQTALSIHFFYF